MEECQKNLIKDTDLFCLFLIEFFLNWTLSFAKEFKIKKGSSILAHIKIELKKIIPSSLIPFLYQMKEKKTKTAKRKN